MLSVPRSEKDVLPLLKGRLAVAAVNAPGMCVVAGPHDEVEALSATARRGGRRLPAAAHLARVPLGC